MAGIPNTLATEAAKPFIYSSKNEFKKSFIVVDKGIAKSFDVSEQLLKRYTPNFYATIMGRDHKETAKAHNLDHESSGHFVTWLKQQPWWDDDCEMADAEAPKHSDEDYDSYDDYDEDDGTLFSDTDSVIILCVQLYAFGCKYDIQQLRNDATDRMFYTAQEQMEDEEFSHSDTEYVYNNTDDNSPLRRILVNIFCDERVFEESDKKLLLEFPKEFVADALVRHSMDKSGWCLNFVHMHAYHGCKERMSGGKGTGGCHSRIEERERD